MTKKQTVEIGGMSCGHCLMAVRNALEALEGVTVDEVKLGKATVSVDDAIVTSDAVAEAVRDAGYDVLAVT